MNKMICDDCDTVYVGQTGRDFIERYKEHLPMSNNNNVKSTYGRHLLQQTEIIEILKQPLYRCKVVRNYLFIL